MDTITTITVEKFDSISIKMLENQMNKHLGLFSNNISYTKDFKNSTIMSEDIADRTTIIRPMFKTLHIIINVVKYGNTMIYRVSFQYTHPNHGSNGYSIGELRETEGVWSSIRY